MRNTPRRFSTAACDSVVTFMPSATLVAQAGSNLGCPSTETRQMRQLQTIGSLGYQQRVGLSIPTDRAASRRVASAPVVIARPSIVMVGMREKMIEPGPAGGNRSMSLWRLG